MLAAAQGELEAHFAALAALRRPHGYPVYALEHGLEADRIDALAEAASRSLLPYGPRDQHWLVWAALAAEAGYRYAGDEYWPALERRPGEWRSNDQRQWLRHRFRRFKDRFGGPEPVGRWADQFSIIAWPIANAILPRYLQAHFAAQLHARRWVLADQATIENADLGQLLLADYDGSSSRFADFLQQTELTTQIVRALRECDIGAEMPRILPALLERIVADLEVRRDSRELLRAARSVISSHRASVAPALRTPVAGSGGGGGGLAPLQPISPAARLADGTVLLGLIFPDIATALARAGLDPQTLANARVRSSGSPDRPEPALSLLGLSRRDRAIPSFPPSGQPVVQLETGDRQLHAVVQPLLALADAPLWLLRRHADGLYREVRGRQVRTGETYLILAREALAPELVANAKLTACPASATGVQAYALGMPSLLEAEQRTALIALGIGVVTGIRIDPLGLAPTPREGDGWPQWTAGETVLLRLAADYSLAGFSVRLDDGPASLLSAQDGETFLALDPLALGEHRLSVRAAAAADAGHHETGEPAAFDFAIMPPQPWPDGMRGKAGFRLLLEPAGSPLEALLAGSAEARVFGPAGRLVNWSLETFDATGHVAAEGDGGTSPVGSAVPVAVLDRLRQTLSEAIDAAHRIDLVASLGELGRQALAFPHKVEPLRWRFDAPARRARLIDETAHDEPVTARLYPLATPLTKARIAYDDAVAGVDVAAPGALLIADYRGRQYAIFASAPAADRLRALSDLGFAQNLALDRSDHEVMLTLLTAHGRWRRARPVGPQAIVRKEITLGRITAELAVRACGGDFAQRIARADRLPDAQRHVGGSPGFGLRMRTFVPPSTHADGLEVFSDIARRYGIEQDGARIADAYRLAFDPAALRFGPLESARARISDLLANRPLVRGAYLAAAAARFGRAQTLAAAV